ncbi:lipopolysaccharide heptosyltransferase II [Selenihalanaerobacter shriftii]|uniref:lipopolysaccharide heptosyltransferase II n=1 Tax=Selenihalanaerobacter shriftii TaxID=142842 RepID=A0A1T4KWP0_9FIRM|nr:lipopolysaccharide heptosyltransferase II [Selenihalanaerobacter shriftii]SJZ46862.1 heptosyltransferase-3 [Selenihalanaerobacter shriftii]
MNEEIKNAKRIVVIDLLYLGDLLFATPFFQNLRNHYPEARIDLVVNSNFFDIIEESLYFDNIYAYNKNWKLKENWQFAKKLNKNNYDLGLNIHGNWRTAILLRLINPDYTVGYGGKGKGIWLNQELASSAEKHMAEVYLDFLEDLGINEIDEVSLDLNVNPRAQRSMQKFLKAKEVKASDKVVGLNTGGSWPTKQWKAEGFARLADRLQIDYNTKAIFFGGPGDVDRVGKIISKMQTTPIVAAGETSLKELAALAAECDLFISGDTGPIHVAASVGTPTIAIFGPSNEVKYHPYGEEHHVVKTDIDCRPCGDHECSLKHHDCMEKIEVDDILRVVEEEI